MSLNLDQIFYLNRSSRYINSQNTNDLLPIIYGDLTDGTKGIWELPNIDTVNDVYCFASHAVLSVANGNSITIYEDNVTVNPANYTFSDSNNYESEGVIATITFTTPPAENATISARGKGKYLLGDSTSLMTNVIDMAVDFLTVESGIITINDFDTTQKTTSYNKFVSQSYSAAGIINSDDSYWSTLYKMMGSFKGDVIVNAENIVVLIIDTGTIPSNPDEILSKGDVKFIGARLRRENIINRVPSSYRYNYLDEKFLSHTDATGQIDQASINIYGTRTPTTPYTFYFARDSTTVNTIQSLIIAQQNEQSKVWEVEFQVNSLKPINLELGDHVVTSFDLLFNKTGMPLTNEFFKILETRHDFNGVGSIKFRCLDTGTYLSIAHLLDGSWLLDGSHVLGSERDTTQY